MTNRWAVLGLLCFARVSMGLHFQAVAAVAPLLMASLGLTYAQLGVLIGLYTVPGIFLSLPGGLLAARFGDRAVVLAALGLLTLGDHARGQAFGVNPACRLPGRRCEHRERGPAPRPAPVQGSSRIIR